MGTFKFKKGREKLTDSEIQQQMNFDKFISAHTPPVKGWLASGTKLSTVLFSATIVVAITGYLIYHAFQAQPVVAQPFINPPIKAMDIPSDVFSANVDADTIITYSTGSQIKVPADAFVDEEGNDVKGDVEIHYREFHDPIDIMLSGIPMNYDSAGVNYQLESAGMMEVTATQNGKPLHLKPGKELVVNMVSHTNDPDNYNVYKLDTTKKQWEYISENTEKNKTCFPIFEKKEPNKKNTAEDIVSNGLSKPVCPHKVDPSMPNFTIDYNKDEFPELEVYKDLKFEPVKGEKKYSASLAKKDWENVLIERKNDNEHYIITFTRGKESYSFTVTPVVEEKDYEATMKNYSERQNRYEHLLSEKRKSENLQNDSLYKIDAKYRGYAITSNLNERFNCFINDSYMETSKDLLAYRTFSVSKLGVWNCDKPFPFFSSDFKSVSGNQSAEFVSLDNQPIMLKSVYLIKRSINSIYTVPESSFTHFPFYKTSIDVMVGITYENELYYLKDQEFNSVEVKGENIRFKMNRVDKDISKSQQLKKLLKI